MSHRVFSKIEPSKLYTFLSPLYTRSACWWNTILQRIRRRGESGHIGPPWVFLCRYICKNYWTNCDDLYNLAKTFDPLILGHVTANTRDVVQNGRHLNHHLDFCWKFIFHRYCSNVSLTTWTLCRRNLPNFIKKWLANYRTTIEQKAV